MSIPTYSISVLQSQAFRILRGQVYEVLDNYQLTPTYCSMLGAIHEARDGIRQVEIAEQLRVKAPLITVMARELEKKGLIQIVPNQFDARAKLLALTPGGKKLVKSVETELQTELRQLLNGATEADMATYQKVLSIIVTNHEQTR